MTPEAGRRAPFELLAFTAAPVVGALTVIELEGRFGAQGNGRFTRHPVRAVEAAGALVLFAFVLLGLLAGFLG